MSKASDLIQIQGTSNMNSDFCFWPGLGDSDLVLSVCLERPRQGDEAAAPGHWVSGSAGE